MARIRTIKPSFFTSLTIASLTPEQRLTFVGLWTHVDDDGRCIYDPRLIKAALWALDERLARDVEEDVAALQEASLIVLYEVDERRYLAIRTWAEHQRIPKPTRSILPSPDQGVEFRVSAGQTLFAGAFRERSGSPTGALPDDYRGERKGREGNKEGKGELPCSPAAPSSVRAIPARFDEFWEIYPRKVGKDRARTSYLAATRRTDEQVVIDGALRLAQDPNLPEAQFIPHPTTWLNRGGWQDEPLPDRTAHDRRPTADDRAREHLELAARFRELENEPPADLFPQIGS